MIYVAAALVQIADWLRNLKANPQVEMRVKSRHFYARAEVIIDPRLIADFLEVRLQRYPRMMGWMLRTKGLRIPPNREELESYVTRLEIVKIQPD